ncbi:Usually multiple acids move in and out Transporters 25 [Hibiscus trionum]|uniref:Usually multiple acids move in and out Transporters 25 n=1 Tax=Hibiscus trionum TaxID=183268 RepID=A0A9W7MSJ5_HIBTR|nr:Usually multiple acids move in and out Transporters 25 [Hibiscus trionum]
MSNNDSSDAIGSNFFLGPLSWPALLAWAIWFILQGTKNARTSHTCTTIMCFMAGIECTIIDVVTDHKPSAWSLSSPMRLVAALYAVSA